MKSRLEKEKKRGLHVAREGEIPWGREPSYRALRVNEEPLVEKLASVEIEKLAFVYWGMEWVDSPGSTRIGRFYIQSHQDGSPVGCDDLMRLSRQLRLFFSVALPGVRVPLEFSSPGFDRILFRLEQCLPYLGADISVNLAGKKKKGRLCGVDLEAQTLEWAPAELALAEGGGGVLTQTIAWSDCGRVRLLPRFDDNKA